MIKLNFLFGLPSDFFLFGFLLMKLVLLLSVALGIPISWKLRVQQDISTLLKKTTDPKLVKKLKRMQEDFQLSIEKGQIREFDLYLKYFDQLREIRHFITFYLLPPGARI